ncbi:MAG TPA: SDR family NAD(P)-dependent oxidoreductase [Gemmatimonadaceae bacterium]|nr:SDR family NAD(P)-dependent oxidoreductase [Gemmatimonadaceae bacterium]
MTGHQPLSGRVALVAGATRGSGRATARELAAAGATVVCTGRGTPETPSGGSYAGRPETIDETVQLIVDAGGRASAMRADHSNEMEVALLFDRVRRDHGRIDLLVNVLGTPNQDASSPFWELSYEEGRAEFERWAWPHVLTCRHAVPLMLERGGLIVTILEGHTLGYRPPMYFDLAVTAVKRLMYGLAEELAPHGVSTVAIAPGFMRTEHVLAYFGATEDDWRTVAETSESAKQFGLAGSETPHFVGRAIAALAADPEVRTMSGTLRSSWELSERYGFTDVDGSRPHWGRYSVAEFPHIFAAPTTSGWEWRVVPERQPDGRTAS